MLKQWWICLPLTTFCVLAIAGTAWMWKAGNAPSDPEEPAPTSVTQEGFESKPVTSPFLNSRSDVAFTGSESCRECHPKQYASYLQTPHSRALQEVADANLPEPDELHHRLSSRMYLADHSDTQPSHREWIESESGQRLKLNDCPISYAIGSGNHSQSYLIERDGFLFESPMTWYASRQSWDMSPGYDRELHAGFERIADLGCINCHAGRVEAVEGNMYRLDLHETAIGCESCHGPGQVHQQAYQSDADVPGELDKSLTIVNPDRLSRILQESICGNCHLRGDSTVVRRGKQLSDFRPGLPLSETRIDYTLANPSGEMTVVGHVAQMRLSRCYTETDSLTCTTCHDPHDRKKGRAAIEAYRQVCLECHSLQACGIPTEDQRRQQREDNCVSCHMPSTSTDLPHFAFTHHRIAVHEETNESPALTRGRLVPAENIDQLSPTDRQRNLGLAYLELSDKTANAQLHGSYRRESFRLLSDVESVLRQDGDVAAALARLHWELGDGSAGGYVKSALNAKFLSTRGLTNALLVRGDLALRSKDWRQAEEAFAQLTELRRAVGDWMMLSEAQWQGGRRQQSLSSLQTAVEISPSRTDLLRKLAERLVEVGEKQEAADLLQRASDIDRLIDN